MPRQAASFFGAFRCVLIASCGITACLLAPSAPAAEPAEWNQWRGADRDGVIKSKQLPGGLTNVLKLQWQKPHQPSYSGPIVHGDLVFTTETVNQQDEKVTAYRIEDGSVAWEQSWPGSLAVPFFAAANGSWIRSTPVVAEDSLIVVGMRDEMHCFDPETGKRRWKVNFSEDFGSPLPMFGASCSPLIDEGRVYMQTGGATVCLSLADGKPIWTALEATGTMQGGAFSSPIIATICGKRQLLVQTRTKLCGVDLASGNVFWEQPIEAYRGMNILTPLVSGNQIFTSAHSGRAQLFEIKYDGSSWEVVEVWNQKQQAYMSSPVIAAGKIFLHLKNERITALDLKTGEAVFVTQPIGKYASFITDGTKVLALTDKGKLMLIDAEQSDWTVIDEVQVAKDSWAHLALARDRLIVRDLNELKVFQLQ